jgi:hypothetical protein
MISVANVEAALARLDAAVTGDASDQRCRRRWSEFIRIRDDNRCVDCHSRHRLSAHHICRKSFLPEAKYQTGNGITLCWDCHRQTHQGFNGRPDLSTPMDLQGGEKIRIIERLYCILADDAKERGRLQDDLYFLSDQVLAKFKLLQGFDWATPFPGSRVEQAYLIWAQAPLDRLGIAEANGFPMINGPILPGSVLVVFDDNGADSD